MLLTVVAIRHNVTMIDRQYDQDRENGLLAFPNFTTCSTSHDYELRVPDPRENSTSAACTQIVWLEVNYCGAEVLSVVMFHVQSRGLCVAPYSQSGCSSTQATR